MNPKPYDEYKDSGVDWIGSVPAHWPLSPLRSVVEERRIKNPDGNEAFYLSLVSGRGVIPYSQKGDIGNKMPEDLSRCKVVEEGDLVINSMNYGIGSYGVSSYQGICSPVYIVLRPKPSVDVSFIKRIFEVRGFQKLAQSFGSGILEHRSAISWQTLKTLRVPVPTLTEQRVIAEFLDRETAEIDAFIADQERLIELLEERRAATITHAVTKGLEPDAPMKDSGLGWLSAVPSPWEVNKIGRISEFTVGWTPPTGIQEYFEGDNKWANISDLGPRTICDTAKRISDNAVKTSRLKVSPRGSLLFGFKLSVGDVSFAGTDMYTNEAIATFFESKCVTLQYAYYAYPLFIIENAGENIYGARILNQERIRNAKIAFPPIEEQRAIADFLDRETAEIDAAVSDAREAIALSRERRAALISAAVTGQIDVSQTQRPAVQVLEDEVRV